MSEIELKLKKQDLNCNYEMKIFVKQNNFCSQGKTDTF